MTVETLKSPNPRNRNSISVIKSTFLSVPSMNTLLATLKVTDARRDVILAGRLNHRFPWRHLGPPPPPPPRLGLISVTCRGFADVKTLKILYCYNDRTRAEKSHRIILKSDIDYSSRLKKFNI